jgi:hypothetical protein
MSYLIECDGYTIDYSGGRLADVLVNGSAVECVEVRAYDWGSGAFTEPFPAPDVVAERVEAFMAGATESEA